MADDGRGSAGAGEPRARNPLPGGWRRCRGHSLAVVIAVLIALLIGLYATERAGRPVALLVAATPPTTNAVPAASAPTTQPATVVATVTNAAPAIVAPALSTPAASTAAAGASPPLQAAPVPQTQASSTPAIVAPAVAPAVQPSASGEPSATSIAISAGGPPAAAAPAAPAQTQTPASPATPGGGGSGSAPAPAISVPSATPFAPPAIVPVTPISGANQTPGPVATLSLAGGGAGGGVPAGGAGTFSPGAAPASLQSHGPSAAVIVALVLGMLGIGALILCGARALWKPERQHEGDAGTARARRM